MKSFFIKLFASSLVLIGGVFLGSTQVQAHPLDETRAFIYLVNDNNRKILPDKTVLVKLEVSWQQISFIHEIGEDRKIEPETLSKEVNVFDKHMRQIYASPEKHRNYISENIEIKSQGEDCDLISIEESKYIKEEVLMGGGVTVNILAKCTSDPVGGVSFLNRMFFESFPYQRHEAELYLYNKLVAQGVLDAKKRELIYPEPVVEQQSSDLAEIKPSSGYSGWKIIFLSFALLLVLLFIITNRKSRINQ